MTNQTQISGTSTIKRKPFIFTGQINSIKSMNTVITSNKLKLQAQWATL